jgi:CRP-like cAMP-binding protein
MSAANSVNLPSDDVRNVLDALASSVAQPKNTVLFNQGDAPIGVYIVRKGTVRMTVNAGGSEVLMRVAHSGAVLGLPGVLGNKPYSLTAITTQATELGFVPAEKLVEAIRGNPGLGLQVLQLLSEDVRAARGAIANTRQAIRV